MVSIGPYPLRNPVLLAPMAGITDAPFRALAWRFGAGYLVSEMLASREQLWNTAKSRLRRQPISGAAPRAVQIAGGDPETVAAAARRHWQDGAEIIDINFGCPAKKVCRRAAGSQLLNDPALVAAIVRATVAAVPVPVTVKMRTGWSPALKNGVEIAHIAEQEGAAAVVVHGRTRACRFEGAAEYATVAEIKHRLRIPVFANGDITTPGKALRVMNETGVDGVMIGRAALGAPWLLGMIAEPGRGEPPFDLRWAVMAGHVAALHDFYGEPGVRIARKHVQWYLQRMFAGTAADDGVTADAAAGVDARAVDTGAGPDPARCLAREFNTLQDAGAQTDWLASRAARLAA